MKYSIRDTSIQDSYRFYTLSHVPGLYGYLIPPESTGFRRISRVMKRYEDSGIDNVDAGEVCTAVSQMS
jgi:hypothetical protein